MTTTFTTVKGDAGGGQAPKNTTLSRLRSRVGENVAPVPAAAPASAKGTLSALRSRLGKAPETETPAPAPAPAKDRPDDRLAVVGEAAPADAKGPPRVPTQGLSTMTIVGDRIAGRWSAARGAVLSPLEGAREAAAGCWRRLAARIPAGLPWGRRRTASPSAEDSARREPVLSPETAPVPDPAPPSQPMPSSDSPQPARREPPLQPGARQPDAPRRPESAPHAGPAPRPEPVADPAPAPMAAIRDDSLSRVLRPWRLAGWGIIVFFIVGSMVWAATTHLDAAAVAHGTVAVESNHKTIQHLEGGIIQSILVSEGDWVEAGQPLIKFDDTYTRANQEMLEGRYASALALHARLITERDGAAKITFPAELLEQADDPKIKEIITGETDIFKSRGTRLGNQESILRQRIEKHRREITGLRAQVDSGRKQLALLNEEIATLDDMFKKGVVSKSRLLAMQRQAAAISGEIGDNVSKIARAEKSINEVRLQLTAPRNDHLNQVTEQLQKVQGEIADLREKMLAAKDVSRRITVIAPQSGTVVGLQVHTAGGVVQPGQPLMDLVPDKDRLIIDVRVDPRDIDAVYAGMKARVRLTAFSARTTPMLNGEVTSVSADRVTDPATGQSYFTARVVPTDDPKAFDLSRLKAGMQAEVFLVTAERTALDYMIEPLVRSFARAGREQ